MRSRTLCLATLTLGALLLSGAHASEEQAVAAPKKDAKPPVTEASKKKVAPPKAAASEIPPAERVKECNTDPGVNTLEDMFRATDVAAILDAEMSSAPESAYATTVVWRRAE